MARSGTRKLITQLQVSEDLLTLADPALRISIETQLQQKHARALARVARRCQILSTEWRQIGADMDFWMRGLVRFTVITRLYCPRHKLNVFRH